MRKLMAILTFVFGLAGLASSAQAAVNPHGLFTDRMVLQQGMKVPVWGTAEPGEEIIVRIQGQAAKTTAMGGKWRVDLAPLKAGGPFVMTVEGKTEKIKLVEVLVGEVWVASGQSNMEAALANGVQNPKEAIASSKQPQLRLFYTPKTPSGVPQENLGKWKETPRWKASSPQTTPGFSAAGYFFGRDLHLARKVPVGIIQSAWGGTAAERWTRKEVLDGKFKGLKGSDLYNGMIVPLQPFAIQGVIWYQGESNGFDRVRSAQYFPLFSEMIKSWRTDWKQGEFPFLFVQLAPFDRVKDPEGFAVLRESQLRTWQTVPSTAMVVITDGGHPTDIHPRHKDVLGQRLALAARALAYKEDFVWSGPLYSGHKIEGDKVVLNFKHLGGGLVAKGGDLTGFTIAGKDGQFVKGQATIVENTVVVSSPEVKSPAAVRYGWANHPVVNLYNREGLPATPFRTDMPEVKQAK